MNHSGRGYDDRPPAITKVFAVTYRMGFDMMERAEPGIRAPGPALTTSDLLEARHVMAAHYGSTSFASDLSPIPDPYSSDPWSWAFVLFRQIPGLPWYGADTEGRAWSRLIPRNHKDKIGDTWRRLNPALNQAGYPFVALYRGPQDCFTVTVHTLVLRVFVGECPEGMEARHFPSNDRTDCRLANLRWGTPLENGRDQYSCGTRVRGERARSARLKESDIPVIFDMSRSGMNIARIARVYRVDRSSVSRILSRKAWAHVDVY